MKVNTIKKKIRHRKKKTKRITGQSNSVNAKNDPAFNVVAMPIMKQKKVCDGTTEITFKAGEDFKFKPGQYIRVTLPQLQPKIPGGNTRDFTISSSPNKKGSISITFRDSGSDFKKALLSAPNRTSVMVQGPLGMFTLPKDGKISLVFIAGGMGVTPFLSMIRYLDERKSQQKVTLIYVNSTIKRASNLKELKRISKKTANFTLINKLGNVDCDFIKKSVKYTANTIWYLCGPPNMVMELTRLIPQKLNVHESNLRTEEYVGYDQAKTDYMVFAPVSNTIPVMSQKEAVIFAGKTPFSCANEIGLITITDIQGMIIYVNMKFIEVSRYSWEELIGQNSRILKSGFHSPQFYQDMWLTISNGKIWRDEIKNRAKDGSFYWVDTTISPILEKGKIKGYMAVGAHVTDKKAAETDLLKKSEATLNILEDIQLAQARLRERENSFQTIFESAYTGIIAVDTITKKIILTNKRMIDILGYTKKELLQLKLDNITKIETIFNFSDLMTKKLPVNELSNHQLPVICKDKKIKYCDVKMKILKINGKDHVISFFNDITQQKAVIEKLRIKDYAIDSSDTGIVITNLDGVIEYANDSFIIMWNLGELTSIISEPLAEFLPEDMDKKYIFTSIKNKGEWQDEIKIEDGKIRYVKAEAHLVQDDFDKPLSMVFSFTEITEEKITELIRLDFTNIAAHELKTPITPLKSFLSLIKEDPETYGINKTGLDYINTCLRNVNRLDRLIGDILDISKLDSGGMNFNFEKFDIVALINTEIANFNEQLHDKKLILATQISIEKKMIYGDKGRIAQVIDNLIKNAIKFTDQGRILVQLTARKSRIQIDVLDTGIGVRKSDIDKLFTRFFQAEDISTRKTKGTGLGLVISKEIIKAHQGRLWVKSAGRGKGSMFSFTLPIKAKFIQSVPKILPKSK